MVQRVGFKLSEPGYETSKPGYESSGCERSMGTKRLVTARPHFSQYGPPGRQITYMCRYKVWKHDNIEILQVHGGYEH